MKKLSQRILNLKDSGTIMMAQKASELKACGEKILDLSLGEPDFHTPEFIKEAAKKAIDENYTFYSPIAGYPELKEAIIHKLKRDRAKR